MEAKRLHNLLFALVAIFLFCLLGLSTTPVMADVSGVFEINDGNGEDVNPPEPEDDWNTIIPGTTDEGGGVFTGPPFPSNPPYTAEALISTFVDGARGGNRFTGGSKDEQGINEWVWDDNNPPPGNDFINSYAAAYVNGDGDLLLVCGLDRYQTNGSFAIGCWFFQEEVAPVGTTGGSFSGNHADGDVLVTAEFGGQGVTAVNVFEWECGTNTGLACDTSGTLVQVSSSQTDFQCSNNGDLTSINACGETNLGTINIPWEDNNTYKRTVDGLVPAGTFLEVIVNISNIFPGGASCFSSFMATSRSSSELRAELKEFEIGGFDLCKVAATKVCAPDPSTGFCVNDSSTACTVPTQDTDCGTGNRCITTNPYIAADGVTIVMDNVLNISNPGVATVYDCQVKENTAFFTGESCQITAVEGTAVSPAVDLSDGVFHAIPQVGSYNGSIANGDDIDVTVQCETFRNPYPNQVDVRCANTDGGALNVSASNIDLDTSSDACEVAPVGDIDVSKSCIDVRLAPIGGNLVVETVYDITVQNLGTERLDNVTLTDTATDGTVYNLLTSGDNVSLAPGASLTFNVVDTPSMPDQNFILVCSESAASCTVDSDCPNSANGETCVARYDQESATFSDTAQAAGIGAVSTQTATDMETLNPPCKICPDCPECPASN